MKRSTRVRSFAALILASAMTWQTLPASAQPSSRASGPEKKVHKNPTAAEMQKALHDFGTSHTVRFTSKRSKSAEAVDLARSVLLTSIDDVDEFSFYMPDANTIFLARGRDSAGALKRLLKNRRSGPRSRMNGAKGAGAGEQLIRQTELISDCVDEGAVLFYDPSGDVLTEEPEGFDFDAMKCDDLIAEYTFYLDGTAADYQRRIDLEISAGEMRGASVEGYREAQKYHDDSIWYLWGFVDEYEFTLETDHLPDDRLVLATAYPNSDAATCSTSYERSFTTGWSIGSGVSFGIGTRKGGSLGVSVDRSFTYSQELSESNGVSCELEEYTMGRETSNGNLFTVSHVLNRLGRDGLVRSFDKNNDIPYAFSYLCDNHNTVNCHRTSHKCEGKYNDHTLCCEYNNGLGNGYCHIPGLDTMPETVTDGYEQIGAVMQLQGNYDQDTESEDELSVSIRTIYNPGFRAWHQASDNREMFVRHWESWDIASALITFPKVSVNWLDQRLFPVKAMVIKNSSTTDYLAAAEIANNEVTVIPEGAIDGDYTRDGFPLQNLHVFYPEKLGSTFFETFRVQRYKDGRKFCLAGNPESQTVRLEDCDTVQGSYLTWQMETEYPDQLCLTDYPELCLFQQGNQLGLESRCEPEDVQCTRGRWQLSDPITRTTYCEYLKLEYGGNSCFIS